MIKVLYASIADLTVAQTDELINSLPAWRQESARSLKQEHERKLSAAAGLLLMRALDEAGISRDVVVSKNSHGKPYLRDHSTFHFSLSHSGSIAICAISDTPIGCDVQKISSTRPQVARRFFTPAEQLCLQGSAAPQAQFARIWTRKESYVKMRGLGISACPLTSFDVSGTTTLPGAVFYEYSLPDHCITVCSTVVDEIRWKQYEI